MMKKENTFLWFSCAIGLFILFVFLAVVVLSIQGCQPRSATMCVNQATNTWVKCPAGVAAGSAVGTQPKLKTWKQSSESENTKKANVRR